MRLFKRLGWYLFPQFCLTCGRKLTWAEKRDGDNAGSLWSYCRDDM